MCQNAEEWMYWISMKVLLSQCSVSDDVQGWLAGQEQDMSLPYFLSPDTGHQQFKDLQRFGLNTLTRSLTSYFCTMI